MSADEDRIILQSGATISAPGLLRASTTQQGGALKLHIPLLYAILPSFIQAFLRRFSIFSALVPKWSQRFLIQCGSYFYKFKNEEAKEVKGSPLRVDCLDVHLVTDHEAEMQTSLPLGFNAVFCVSTLRKKQYYAVPTKEDALVWVRSLNDGRQEAIRRSMGHTGAMDYPKSLQYFDDLASKLVKTKDRIRQRMEDESLKEMEMSNLTEGGPMSRGFYG